jgi:hypothetical protein
MLAVGIVRRLWVIVSITKYPHQGFHRRPIAGTRGSINNTFGRVVETLFLLQAQTVARPQGNEMNLEIMEERQKAIERLIKERACVSLGVDTT